MEIKSPNVAVKTETIIVFSKIKLAYYSVLSFDIGEKSEIMFKEVHNIKYFEV